MSFEPEELLNREPRSGIAGIGPRTLGLGNRETALYRRGRGARRVVTAKGCIVLRMLGRKRICIHISHCPWGLVSGPCIVAKISAEHLQICPSDLGNTGELFGIIFTAPPFFCPARALTRVPAAFSARNSNIYVYVRQWVRLILRFLKTEQTHI